jgi:hypothetical protein
VLITAPIRRLLDCMIGRQFNFSRPLLPKTAAPETNHAPLSIAVKTPKSKAQERLEIESQIEEFLREGGMVQSVERGISGRELGAKLPPVAFQQPRMTRTPLVEEIKAIEARRKPGATPKRPQSRQPKRVLITDDFGEPLRWSWQEK